MPHTPPPPMFCASPFSSLLYCLLVAVPYAGNFTLRPLQRYNMRTYNWPLAEGHVKKKLKAEAPTAPSPLATRLRVRCHLWRMRGNEFPSPAAHCRRHESRQAAGRFPRIRTAWYADPLCTLASNWFRHLYTWPLAKASAQIDCSYTHSRLYASASWPREGDSRIKSNARNKPR